MLECLKEGFAFGIGIGAAAVITFLVIAGIMLLYIRKEDNNNENKSW